MTGLSRLDGADAAENETSRFFQDEDKTWYRSRVRVTSARIRWRIDAKEVVAVDDRERPVGTRIETRGNQPLGFATWETGGALRNLAIRTLTPAEVAATNASDKGRAATARDVGPHNPAEALDADWIGGTSAREVPMI